MACSLFPAIKMYKTSLEISDGFLFSVVVKRVTVLLSFSRGRFSGSFCFVFEIVIQMELFTLPCD